jgi:hypothetical protein
MTERTDEQRLADLATASQFALDLVSRLARRTGVSDAAVSTVCAVVDLISATHGREAAYEHVRDVIAKLEANERPSMLN